MTIEASPPMAADVRLRPTLEADLEVLYSYHADPSAAAMAMMIPRDRPTFMADWTRFIADPAVTLRSILADGALVGSISCFDLDGLRSVGYFIGQAYWSRGIATKALQSLLVEVPTRPLHARAARSNVGSINVLLRTGFTLTGYRHAPAEGRYLACEEAIFELR